ncbi:hypothetical protein HA466_0177430 [Hirschfeldia incana]|nr:hypothetical protein HA466_0177430 [Hirschfeldia incana]
MRLCLVDHMSCFEWFQETGKGRWSPCLMWKNELKNLWHVWRRPTLHCDPTANGPSLKTLMKFVPFKISFLSTTMVTIS